MGIRTIAYGLAFLLVAGVAATAQTTGATPADRPISVLIDGQPRQYDASPVIVQDRVLLPMRGVFEDFGASVDWNSAQRMATAYVDPERTISLTIGSTTALVDGQSVALDVPAQLHRDRVYLPLRFLCAATGYSVTWEGAKRRVAIATPTGTTMAKAPVCPAPREIAVAEPAPIPEVGPGPMVQPEPVVTPSEQRLPLACPIPCPAPTTAMCPAPCPGAAPAECPPPCPVALEEPTCPCG